MSHVLCKAASQQDTATYMIGEGKMQIHKKRVEFTLQENFRLTKQKDQSGWDRNIIAPYSCELCYRLSSDHTKSKVHIQEH